MESTGHGEFISYSANLEDVLLKRIFQNVAVGFFVDVGAAHPEHENDTKALYERGWRGINVEPNEDFLEELRRQRPEDVNLGVVVAGQAGEALYYKVPSTGLSTIEADNAERATSHGHLVETRRVPTVTLAQILDEARAPREFEVLKVDVEGAERAVLTGNDWSRYRPRVIVVEATVPESPVRRDDGVRQFLLELGWRHVWFDGLNDWYLAPDFMPPPTAFEAPPNVFDRYAVRRTVEAERQAVWLRDTLVDREKAILVLQRQEAELRELLSDKEAELRKLVELSGLRSEVGQLRAALAEGERTRLELNTENHRLELENRHLHGVVADHVLAHDETRRTTLGLDMEKRRLELENQHLHGVIANHVSERAETCRAMSGLQAALIASRLEVSAAAHQRDELEQHQRRVAALQRDLLASRQEVVGKIASMKALQSQNEQKQVLRHRSELEKAHHQIDEAHQQLDEAHQQLDEAHQQLDEARQMIRSLISSTSWRISGPLRVIGRMLKRR